MKGSLDRILLAAESEFLKILVPRLPQNASNVNIEHAGKSKQLITTSFYCSDINPFLVDYASYKLYNIWLLLFEKNFSSITMQGLHTGGKTLLQLLLKRG